MPFASLTVIEMRGFAKTIFSMVEMIALCSAEEAFINFNLAGVLKKRFSTVIDVPFALESTLSSMTFPPTRYMYDAVSSPAVREIKVTSDTDAMLARASPLKPRDDKVSRSRMC